MKLLQLRELRISSRLYLGFGVVLGLMLAVAMLGLAGMAASQARLEGIVDGNTARIRQASTMRDAVYERMIALRNLALVNAPADMQVEVDRIAREAQRYRSAQKALLALQGGSSLMAPVARFDQAAAPLVAQAQQLALTGQVDQMYTVLTQDLLPLQSGWMAALNALIAHEEAASREAMRQTGEAYRSARLQVAGLGLLAALAGVGISVLITRKLSHELGGEPGAAAAVANRIAAGDLSRDDNGPAWREGSLMQAVAVMRERLATIVGEVRSNAHGMASGVEDIVSVSVDLTARTVQQAGALESTQNVMARMTTAVQKNVEHAARADQAVSTVAVATRRGSEALAEVESSMETMSASARSIAEIIGVIDGIAFQTNILALNAAVEAARAGEQGRGFAVVASEVRTLAQRSAAAATQIKELIGTSQATVQASNRIVGEAGEIMTEIRSSVESVERIMASIAAASDGQHGIIVEVNQSLAQMARVTANNAELVADTADSAQALGALTAELNKSVSQFRDSEHGARAPAASFSRSATQ